MIIRGVSRHDLCVFGVMIIRGVSRHDLCVFGVMNVPLSVAELLVMSLESENELSTMAAQLVMFLLSCTCTNCRVWRHKLLDQDVCHVEGQVCGVIFYC